MLRQKKIAMKNVSQKNFWRTGAVQIYVDSPLTPWIKSKIDLMIEDYAKIKLCRNPTSEKLDIYEFKLALFDNDDPKWLLFCVWGIKKMLEAPGMLAANVKLQYLYTQWYIKALRKFETLYVQIRSMTMKHLNQVILGLGT